MANPRKRFLKLKTKKLETKAQARGRYLKVAPTKVRDLLDLIRGKDVVSAGAILKFSGRKGGREAAKVLKSALSNAGNPANPENWYVTEARADKGPIFRRAIEPKPRGARGLISTNSSHIVLGVGQAPVAPKQELVKKGAKEK